MATTKAASGCGGRFMHVARVLLVDDDPRARLTLQTVLKACGYHVDSAASTTEALDKMDEREYELVLSNLQQGAPDSDRRVLAYARTQHYRPATAVLRSYQDAQGVADRSRQVVAQAEDIPELLGKVAGLISCRATRRLARELRQLGN